MPSPWRSGSTAIISIDTYKAGVARAAIEAGAEIVNDISGFRWDARMAKTVAQGKVGAVLMPAQQSGSPMSYTTGGKQYIIVAISGGNYSGEYVAWALPNSMTGN